MFGTIVIVFREVLEAALIIGIVAAATRGIAGRSRWLGAGLGLGLVGSGLVAAGTGVIAQLADGVGQELFNAAILGIAVAMLAWHNIWMSAHGRELATNASAVGAAVRDGRKELSVLMAVVALAVLREGSETVLFLYGVAVSGPSTLAEMLGGGLLGIAGGAAVGIFLYAGLLRIPLRWFFAVTSLLVLLLAAGMAGQAARFLIQADLLPSLATPIWDTSRLVANDSPVGSVLHSLVGYDARPAGMQLIFYVAVVIAIAAGMKWAKQFETR
jgi:high-affinity iron transporter